MHEEEKGKWRLMDEQVGPKDRPCRKDFLYFTRVEISFTRINIFGQGRTHVPESRRQSGKRDGRVAFFPSLGKVEHRIFYRMHAMIWTMEDRTASIRDLLSDAGASLVGIADLSPEGLSPIPALRTAVVWGCALDPAIVRTLAAGPSVAYSREYTAVNARLAAQERRVVAYLEEMGYQAVGISPTTGDFDKVTLSAEFPHKTAATRAGLGWVGKCALLVTREYGSAIRFTSVLTDAPLTPDTPVERSYCGTCEECRKACPVAAPSGRQWEPGLDRDAFWDSRACYGYCQKVKDEKGLDLVCGICIVACPWTRKYLEKSE